ncbi:MAG TPA: DUF992 domain-containing protein [Xanthobacteraceae bacterium]|nr:DUF992 domain-containing protein [Xanthobacteraceae bacterium]
MRIDLRAATAALAFLGIAAVTPANAQERVRAGTLQCEGGGQTSYILGSVTEMFCVFVPEYGSAQRYRATLRRFGGDVGMTTRNALAWAVLAPTRQVGPGEIAGVYGGVAAAAAFGVGGAVNVLFGGSYNSYALQPVSFQGSQGVNAAGGIASLELTPVRPMRSRHRRR